MLLDFEGACNILSPRRALNLRGLSHTDAYRGTVAERLGLAKGAKMLVPIQRAMERCEYNGVNHGGDLQLLFLGPSPN